MGEGGGQKGKHRGTEKRTEQGNSEANVYPDPGLQNKRKRLMLMVAMVAFTV